MRATNIEERLENPYKENSSANFSKKYCPLGNSDALAYSDHDDSFESSGNWWEQPLRGTRRMDFHFEAPNTENGLKMADTGSGHYSGNDNQPIYGNLYEAKETDHSSAISIDTE